VDISTGRCPNKKQNCSCERVCAGLYGKEVRRLKSEIDNPDNDPSPKERELRIKVWQDFININAHKI
jgi:hypothetical protein